MLNNANNLQQQANIRFAARIKAQNEREKRGLTARRTAEADRMKAVRAVQWRTRFNAVERKLIELKNYLRYNPQDSDLRQECETIEQMYKMLLDEVG